MKIIAIYLRTSTEMQANGLDAQLKALEAYCVQRSISNYEIFQDFGVSGSKVTRPGLDQMMKKVRDGVVSSVIVYSFSRFARSTSHLILALQEFQSLGISFISITESIDTSTPIGRTVFAILASVAELERDLIRERVKNGMRAAKQRGKQIGAKRRYENVNVFLELRARGMTIREIAKTLKCSAATVQRVLKASESEGCLSVHNTCATREMLMKHGPTAIRT